jgi:isopenicillin N synthase-like dioxygenase
MHDTAIEITRLIARGLGANENWFDNMFSPYPLSTLRIINYPVRPQPIPECARDGKYTLHCGAHTDTPFITLLATFDYPGLQIQDENDQWVDVPVRSNSLVFNIGDVLSKMTGRRLKATRHRVVDMGRARQSLPYFLEPRFDANINRNIVDPKEIQDEKEVHYGPWLLQNIKDKGYVEVKDLLELLVT